MKTERLFECLDHGERTKLLAHLAKTLAPSDLLDAIAAHYDKTDVLELHELSASLKMQAQEMRGMGL